MNAPLNSWWKGEFVQWVATLAWIFAIVFGLLLLIQAPLGESITGFIQGALGGHRFAFLAATLTRANLIVGMALSVLLCFRAGLINLGGEGQLIAGGLVAALVAICLPGPPLVILIVAMVAGMTAGVVWASIAGVLQVYVGVPLLVSSLLLNFPARFIASYLVAHPFRDVPSGMVQSHLVPPATWLPYFIPGVRLDIGILFIVVVSVLVIFYSHKTVHGYHARLNGLAPEFARAVGLPVKRLTLQTLAMSGALAGLVGAIAVFGIYHRYIDGMLVQPLYAWTGIIAVLLVGMIPWLVPLAGFFFAAVQTGAAGMERAAEVPNDIAWVIQAVIILFVTSRVSGTLMSRPQSREGG